MHRVDVASLGTPRIALSQPLRVSERSLQLVPNLVLLFEEPDRVSLGLAHLGLAVQTHDARRTREPRLRLGERVAEAVIEPPRGVARELEMLKLVFPYRDDAGLVQKYVGAHQHRIHEEAREDVLFALALLLELRHSMKVA